MQQEKAFKYYQEYTMKTKFKFSEIKINCYLSRIMAIYKFSKHGKHECMWNK